MEMIIDFPGGSRVDAHFGNSHCRHRPTPGRERTNTF